MLLAARKTENRHVVIRSPLNAWKIQNYRTFTAAEIVAVNAAAHLLRDDMPTITGSRKAAWPSLCAAMDVWSKQLVVERAVILHIERTRWKQHKECYVHNMLGIIMMSTIAMGKRDVGERNISEVL